MSRLQDISACFRKANISRNDYDKNDEYSGTHPDALSDGDELGKGEKNNSIGSKTDIEQRGCLIGKNTYDLNNPYNDSNA